MAEPGPARPLEAVEFKPLGAAGAQRTLRVSPIWLGLLVLVLLAGLTFTYLLAARAVIFVLDPREAGIDVSGPSFSIGDNYLLLPGRHRITAEADGYYALDTTVEVSTEQTQEIELALDPLPGRLQVNSALTEVEVLLDGEAAGSAPGLIEDIARGPHIVEFRKHRYFPLRQNIEVEGLGRTQTIEVKLNPAWGQLAIRTIPEGAEVQVDGRPVGQTPLTTEVLETGTDLRLSLAGYKTWERRVSVQAGIEESYPPVELVIADGTLDVSTNPSGAHVRVDGEFRGTTPVSFEISPLGERRVELFLEGYRKAVRSVQTKPEGHSSLAVDLQPIIGRIRLTVSPADAEVLVDKRRLGAGSQTLALTAREHELTVQKAGYQPQKQPIRPRPDQDQSLEIRLLTLEQAYWATRPPEVRSAVGASLKLFRPADSFTMGAPRREPGRRANEAERNVRLERPFYLGMQEITNEQFRNFRGEHTSSAVRGHTLDMDEQPVVNVSWNEAALFCNWLSRRDGLPPFYLESNGEVMSWDPDSHGYRLPTEAEWAFAARVREGEDMLMFSWATTAYPPLTVVANYADQQAANIVTFVMSNYDDGFPTTAPVGSFPANHHGLFDLDGNVSEWVHDFFEIRPVRGEPLLDPTGPEAGDRHVIRGASWARASRSELRLAYRNAGRDGDLETGFRIARYVDKAMTEP